MYNSIDTVQNYREWYHKKLISFILCVIVNKTEGLLAQCIQILSEMLVILYMMSF